tara:strand:- start:3377 stop:5518 length:2142 start_codon:yes stop_codon:yes gene_type:complete
MVIKHEPHRTDIDSWADVADDDYCYPCSKWVEADADDKCPICETSLDYTDEWADSHTAKTSIAPSPSVSSTGDIWNRGSAYTWGGGVTWNNSVGGSSLWSTGSIWSTRENSDTASRLLKHKRHLDSLCKVVDPTVKHTLEFSTREGRNYTNMRTGHIVLDGTLVEKNDDKLDVLSGIAIHEKLHVIHTQPLTKWEEKYAYENGLLHKQTQLLHAIANTIEDEYIEKQLAKDNAGFVSYIASTKAHYFDKKIQLNLDEGDKSGQYNDILNTLLALVRYPEAIDDDRRKRHAKHIRFFARALTNALDSRANSLKCIETLYKYMSQLAQKMGDKVGDEDSKEKIEKAIEDKIDELKKALGGSELSDEDWKHMEDKVKRDMERLHRDRRTPMEKAIGDIDKFESICSATDYKPEGQIATEDAKKMRELEDTDYHETKLGRSDCVSPKQTKITWRLAKADSRAIDTYKAESKYIKNQTNKLKRKIDLYGATERLTIRNQKRGRIDKRVLHRIPMGRQDLFKNMIIKEDKPLDVCLLVDESGSMSGSRIRDARRSCIALKEALHDNPKLNLWVMGHTADGMNWHDTPNSTNMTIYHSPNTADRPMAMGSMRAKCENRDGNAILAASGRVKQETESPTSNKLMIIFSDGCPAAIDYGGQRGMNHVRDVVRNLEASGWGIIQVGFGGATYQGEMFTNHIYVNNTNELADKVGKIIRKVIKV